MSGVGRRGMVWYGKCSPLRQVLGGEEVYKYFLFVHHADKNLQSVTDSWCFCVNCQFLLIYGYLTRDSVNKTVTYTISVPDLAYIAFYNWHWWDCALLTSAVELPKIYLIGLCTNINFLNVSDPTNHPLNKGSTHIMFLLIIGLLTINGWLTSLKIDILWRWTKILGTGCRPKWWKFHVF